MCNLSTDYQNIVKSIVSGKIKSLFQNLCCQLIIYSYYISNINCPTNDHPKYKNNLHE